MDCIIQGGFGLSACGTDALDVVLHPLGALALHAHGSVGVGAESEARGRVAQVLLYGLDVVSSLQAVDREWTKARLSKGIGDQLRFIELARARLQQLLSLCPVRKRLQVVPLVYEQQKDMFDNNKRSCENRIVSTEQPHVRPIVRGKRPEPTEFGQKLHLSVVDGYVYLEQTSWNNFNESGDLKSCVAEYYRRFGCYPEAVLADKIYQTKENRKLCKALGIRLSGPALGRKSREQSELEKEQMYKDSCERNWVEGKNGLAKRRYGLDLIMSKLDENAKTEVAFALLAMNASRKLRELLSYLFRAADIFGLFGCSNLDRLFQCA